MKRLKTIVIAGLLAVGLNIREASATGNGNDGCQIGNIPGHKDHGQSNEHKIDYMTKVEWEAYLIANNITAEQMSNNDGSNGWITYHIYDTEGKQIEVVHIRFKKEEVPPVITVPEVPEETPEVPEEQPPVEDTDVPMTPLEPALPGELVEPEAPEETPEDKEEIPMVPLEPSKPIETPEEDVEEEDTKEDEEVIEDQDNIEDDTEKESSVEESEEDEVVCPDDDMFENWIEKDESTENNKDNHINNNIENPKTGDVGLLGYATASIISLGGLVFTRRKR